MVFLGLSGVLAAGSGCEVDSFFDPSKTGYYEGSPISMPILERIDVIERESDRFSDSSPVTPVDLMPSDLEYRLAAGDAVSIEIHDFPDAGVITRILRRVDQAGNVRVPSPLRDFPAAGRTPLELEDAIIAALQEKVIEDPYVTVNLEEGRGFTYSIEGNIAVPGVFTVNRPDFRLSEALAQSGGAPDTTERVFVIRPVPISDDMRPRYRNRPEAAPGGEPEQIDVDDLIDQLNDDEPGGATPAARGAEPIIDIDDYADGDLLASASGNDSFVFLEESGEWVRVRGQDDGQDITGDVMPQGGGPMVLERIIEVPTKRLLADNSLNIVIRPGDRIYVEPPTVGVVYIGGEVFRPGVYQLPARGKLTLSTLVTAAGGPSPLAIPDRVDLTRRVGTSREATIRVSLAAIRQKNEPDIFLKPDDHIILGTSWWANPLAVMRNGFRVTYGYGFLLDRNFGNDVFGAPPVNRVGAN